MKSKRVPAIEAFRYDALLRVGRPVYPDERVMRLINAYTDRRRRIDPWFKPSQDAVVRLAKAAAELQRAYISEARWGEYLDWMFESIEAITSGVLRIPMPVHIGSERWVDEFRDTLGPRRINRKKATEMLAAAGYGDLDACAVIGFAFDAICESRPIGEFLGGPCPERYREAAVWLKEQARAVGYQEV